MVKWLIVFRGAAGEGGLRREFNRAGGRRRRQLGETSGVLRVCMRLGLRILDSVDEKAYDNETREGDSDDDPGKGTSIREWAGQKTACERSITTLERLYHTYELFPWPASELEAVAEVSNGGVPTTQCALSHEVELVCRIHISSRFYH